MRPRQWMKNVIFMSLLGSSFVMAQSGGSDAFRTAFDSCSQKYQRPEPGAEPSANFKACMKAAGFDGPPAGDSKEGRPPGRPSSSGGNSGGSQ